MASTRHRNIAVNLVSLQWSRVDNAVSWCAVSSLKSSRAGVWTSISLLGKVSVLLVHSKLSCQYQLSGNILFFLPPDFDGPITIRQRRGRNAINFLPAFAERARVLRTSERETSVILSSASGTASIANPGHDLCVLGTRSGEITIGLSGYDKPEDPSESGGFLQILGGAAKAGLEMLEVALIGRPL